MIYASAVRLFLIFGAIELGHARKDQRFVVCRVARCARWVTIEL